MTVHTAYQGIEVLATEPEVKSRHPRWGYDEKTLATLQGASLLLLADGTELVVCDGCGYNGLTGHGPYVKPEGNIKEPLYQADSVSSHINGMHHPNKVNHRNSFYDDDQIKVAIKIWLKWRGTGIRNWTQSACDELDRLGFKPFRGKNWTPGALGSLVRTQIKMQKFKNIKAAPMNESDQGTLASMVRDAVIREGSRGSRTVVAANARIVEQRKPTRGRTPIDYGKIIAENEAARAARLKEEEGVAVPISNIPNPRLSFAGAGDGPVEPIPTKTLVVDQTTAVASSSPLTLVVVPSEQTKYEHVVELPDGSPMFKYNGDLMVGKTIKGVEI